MSRSLFKSLTLVGNRRLLFFCLLLFCLSSLISFAWFFPADLVQSRLVAEVSKQTGLQMRGHGAQMLFPFGLQLDLYVESRNDELADVELESLKVRPLWGSLFSDNPALTLDGGVSGGHANAIVGNSGLMSLKAENVELLPFLQPTSPYRLEGTLNGALQSDGLMDFASGKGDFSADLDQTAILGLQKIGLPQRLNLGRVQLSGKFSERRLSIEKFVAAQGVLDLSGGGTLLVGDSPEQTRLNLNVRLHPTETTPESLRDLIQLAGGRPTRDGSYLLRIGGTLAKPVAR